MEKWEDFSGSRGTTVWNMSLFDVFLVRISPHLDWIRYLLCQSLYSVWMRENADQKTLNINTSDAAWWSHIFNDRVTASLLSFPVPHLETGLYYLENIMHVYSKTAKISCIFIKYYKVCIFLFLTIALF